MALDGTTLTQDVVTIVNVPGIGKYQPRSEEDQVLERIEEISRQDKFAKDKGILAIHGDSGVGKTTLISQLIIRHGDFLNNNCGFSFVLWLNCAKWSPDSFDEEGLITALIETSEQGSGFKEIFSSIAKANFYYECKKVKVLLVLDHVSNQNILKNVLERCPYFYCLVVTHDIGIITNSINTEPFPNHYDDETIYDILKNKHKLNLSELQLRDLAKQCRGRPLLADLLACQFQKCKTKRQISAHYICTMKSLQLGNMVIVDDKNKVTMLNSSSLELKLKSYKCVSFDEEQIINLLKDTFDLDLTDSKLQQLALKCYGLPILAGLFAYQLRYCHTKRMKNQQFTSIVTMFHPENSCGKTAVESFVRVVLEGKLSGKERKKYFAILLFHPTEPIFIQHLATLWNCDLNEAEVDCCKFSHLGLMQVQKCKESNDGYTLHELLYQSCLVYAIKSKIGKNLSEIRSQVVTDFTGNESKLLEFLLRCIEDEHWQLIEAIFGNCDEKLLANVCMMPVDNGKWSFIHKLYKTGWFYPISEKSSRKHSCFNMIKRFIARLVRFNNTLPLKSQINIIDIFVKPNEEHCLLLPLFKIQLNSPDWLSLKYSLFRIENLVKTFKRIEWIVEMKQHQCPLVFSAGSGNLKALKKLANAENLTETTNHSLETALIAASKMGHLNVVKFLLEF